MENSKERTIPLSISSLLIEGLQKGASDWHFRGGAPRIRVSRSMEAFAGEQPDWTVSSDELLLATIDAGYNGDPRSLERFKNERIGGIDWAFDFYPDEDTKARFRGTACWTGHGIKIVLRHIPSRAPTMEQVSIPLSIQDDIKSIPQKGLILVGGATGSGKTTAIASMIRYLIDNAPIAVHTLEDPVEYVHSDGVGVVDQLELGRDFTDFRLAFKSAMRCNPDVLLYGELRDEETIESAVTAAESGHLVFATIHAIDAAGAIRRVVDGVSKEKRELIRTQLAGALRTVMCIKLLKANTDPKSMGSKKKIHAAHEVCIVNTAIASQIRDWSPHLISGEIKSGRGEGMQIMDEAIAWLVRENLVSTATAKSYANNPHEFEALCRDISGRPRNQRPNFRL